MANIFAQVLVIFFSYQILGMTNFDSPPIMPIILKYFNHLNLSKHFIYINVWHSSSPAVTKLWHRQAWQPGRPTVAWTDDSPSVNAAHRDETAPGSAARHVQLAITATSAYVAHGLALPQFLSMHANVSSKQLVCQLLGRVRVHDHVKCRDTIHDQI